MNNKQIKLPVEITKLFQLASTLLPNTTASLRPTLLNTMLISRHPASCRAKTSIHKPNLAL